MFLMLVTESDGGGTTATTAATATAAVTAVTAVATDTAILPVLLVVECK